MNHLRAGARAALLLSSGAGALALAGSAMAHANMSPPIVIGKTSQLFTLAVPTEKEGATTTKVELTPPSGFSIDSFVPAPGWNREVHSTGSGEETAIHGVSWSGGNVPHEEDAVFQFLGRTEADKTYAFDVRQTYSDGTVVDWNGPESSDTPAPSVEAESSLGGGGSDTLAIVALVLGAIALVVAAASLLGRSGRRPLA